mmetsp:Transcript_43870/g.121398  ORF Transcript_43870/g.121398 Transcript_43870/m.121398 type:complete len:316 (+) Transcript_43870:163-1110(+)
MRLDAAAKLPEWASNCARLARQPCCALSSSFAVTYAARAFAKFFWRCWICPMRVHTFAACRLSRALRRLVKSSSAIPTQFKSSKQSCSKSVLEFPNCGEGGNTFLALQPPTCAVTAGGDMGDTPNDDLHCEADGELSGVSPDPSLLPRLLGKARGNPAEMSPGAATCVRQRCSLRSPWHWAAASRPVELEGACSPRPLPAALPCQTLLADVGVPAAWSAAAPPELLSAGASPIAATDVASQESESWMHSVVGGGISHGKASHVDVAKDTSSLLQPSPRHAPKPCAGRPALRNEVTIAVPASLSPSSSNAKPPRLA